MTYIRTILPEPDALRKMIAEQGEATIFKRYKKYDTLQGSAESTKIINEIPMIPGISMTFLKKNIPSNVINTIPRPAQRA